MVRRGCRFVLVMSATSSSWSSTGVSRVCGTDEADAGENALTLPSVKTKIKNMRSSYHQELKKIRTNPKYTPKIPWFAPLHSFLAQFLDKVLDMHWWYCILYTHRALYFPNPLRNLMMRHLLLLPCPWSVYRSSYRGSRSFPSLANPR